MFSGVGCDYTREIAMGWCDYCCGLGTIECLCGGDQCVCGLQEYECPVCGGVPPSDFDEFDEDEDAESIA